ncbi:GtrA family protein [bacterium]|nr:GtrA family protein [bacterium]
MKFILVGAISTLIDFVIYVFLTRFFAFWQAHYLWANFMAMIIASTVNFLFNRKWTFNGGRKKALHQYIRFSIVLVGGLFAYQFLFGFFVATLGWYDIIGKAIAAFIIMLIRFHLHKFWVFK